MTFTTLPSLYRVRLSGQLEGIWKDAAETYVNPYPVNVENMVSS